jgi:hypothetical protein
MSTSHVLLGRVPRRRPLLLLSGALLAAACAPRGTPDAGGSDAASSVTATNAAATPAGEWEVLFDGTGLSQWRGYRKQEVPASWRVEDGVLAFTPLEDRAQRGDLITREQYGDFELELEWRISEGGNSGIMYRVGENQEHPYQTGPEMQVLDDARHPDGQIPSHRAGALYDLIVPPPNVARPVGEWNQARIVVRDDRIQQWLNGQKTADVEIGSEEWKRLVAQSKWNEVPSFATLARGHIALQDHDDRVWYRNIRIRRLDAGQ